MKPVRIACVRYLNTAPLIEGLEKLEGVHLIPTVPSRIAELVQQNEADVGLVSLVDVARAGNNQSPLALLPVGMIGCDGPTMTVRLFSSVPLSEIKRVHVDTDSHTSVILCQVLLKRLHNITPRITRFDARERIAIGEGQAGGEVRDTAEATQDGSSLDDAWPETVLLIGDKVVTDPPPVSRYSHQLDLGEAWKLLTGLPFVYAMWACRADRADAPEIHVAAALLDRQRRHNLTRLDWIVARRSADHRWPIGMAHRYLCDLLRFRVGPPERQAAERFLTEAADLGLVDHHHPAWADLTPALAGATETCDAGPLVSR